MGGLFVDFGVEWDWKVGYCEGDCGVVVGLLGVGV